MKKVNEEIIFSLEPSESRFAYSPKAKAQSLQERGDYLFWKMARKYLNSPIGVAFRDGYVFPELATGKNIGQISFRFKSSKPLSIKSRVPFYNISMHIVECLAYDIFLMTNLMRPGAVDYFNFSLRLKNKGFIKKAGIKNKTLFSDNKEFLKLSNFYFESLYDGEFVKLSGVQPYTFEFEKVLNWYLGVRSSMSQVAVSSVEQVIFCLFHISIESESILGCYIWTAHALESLFSDRGSDSPGLIITRALQFLGVKKNEDEIRAALKAFYKIRGQFAHGTFDVYHPARNDILDPKLDDVMADLYGSIKAPVHILILCLQKMVELDLLDIKFNRDGVKGRVLKKDNPASSNS